MVKTQSPHQKILFTRPKKTAENDADFYQAHAAGWVISYGTPEDQEMARKVLCRLITDASNPLREFAIALYRSPAPDDQETALMHIKSIADNKAHSYQVNAEAWLTNRNQWSVAMENE